MTKARHIRRTKIICTIGPSCTDKEVFFTLGEAGMNIARLNFSHGTRESHQKVLDMIAEYNSSHDLPIATLLDTKGAEIRTGDVSEPLKISAGDEVIFMSTTEDTSRAEQKVVGLTYDGFAQDVKETNTILVDNGELSFDIVSINEDGTVIGKANEDGEIGSRRHINLPGADIDLPSITESDWDDISFGISQNIDFVALSFIRNAEEVSAVRDLIDKENSSMKIITKIETQKAVENSTKIIEVSDGIMVARGDLGADVPFEYLPSFQDEVVIRCRDVGKPVIIATHMLESMKDHPVPTRAEVTDVAHAVDTGADATMLSGETASGKHPLLSIQAMTRIQVATEEHLDRLETAYEIRFSDSAEEEMDSAVSQAKNEDVDAFILLTESGRTARHIAKFRHTIPIIAVTHDATVSRSLLLNYGVYPVTIDFNEDDDVSMDEGVKAATKMGLVSKGQKVMLLKNRAQDIEITTL